MPMPKCSCGNEVGNYDVLCSKCGANLRIQEVTAAMPPRTETRDFDPHTDISADAKHIVKHLWIIFVLLPFVVALLWAVAVVLIHG